MAMILVSGLTLESTLHEVCATLLAQDDAVLDNRINRSGWIRVTAAGSSVMQCKDMSSECKYT